MEYEVRWALRSPPRHLRASPAAETTRTPDAGFLRPGPALEKTVPRVARLTRLRFSGTCCDSGGSCRGRIQCPDVRPTIAFLRRATRDPSGRVWPRAGALASHVALSEE